MIKTITLFTLSFLIQLAIGQAPTPELMHYEFNGTGSTVPNVASTPVGSNSAQILGTLTQGGTGCHGSELIGGGGSGVNDYVNTGWATNLTGSSWTISLVYINNGGAVFTYLFSDITAGGFRCYANGSAGAGNTILSGPIGNIKIIGGATIGRHVNTWVYNAAAGTLRSFLDGALNSLTTQSPPTIAGAGPFKIGASSIAGSLAIGSRIDDFRLYNRALTPSEIYHLALDGPPIITCPVNITVNSTTGNCDAIVTYTAPVVSSCSPATTTQTAGFASGATFPVGVTTNTFSSTNTAGTTPCSFTVTVVDAEIPMISCPTNITVSNDSAMCDAVVTYTLPVGADNCTGVTVALTSGLVSGSTFPLGVSTITYIASDAANNTSTPCSFTVTVVDTTLPTIMCPGNMASCDTIVNGIAPISTGDNCAGQYVRYALRGATIGAGMTDASGTDFDLGITTVWYIVTDSAGNADSCSFDVVVHPLPAVTIAAFNPDTICLDDPLVNLPVGTPASGIYSGAGIVGFTFDPSIAGIGTHYVVYSYTDGNSCTNTDSTRIFVRSCVGIDENASLARIFIYPNPTNGIVNIDLGKHVDAINYSISTIEGRIVSQEQNLTSKNIGVDLSSQSKGIYFLKIANATSSKVYKIIKE